MGMCENSRWVLHQKKMKLMIKLSATDTENDK